MALAGAIYARLFGRAANEARGGWLFGMTFGFALWAAGAVMVRPLASGGEMPAGVAAAGLFLSLVVWGAALGTVHPFIDRPLHERLESARSAKKWDPARPVRCGELAIDAHYQPTGASSRSDRIIKPSC